ncbi:MAG TPA: hypothetical protein VN658_06850 [Candidatus Acidoferrales bacterium]|nr:hypothetical protein [Candidatus Acidoferrales bacterium]
MLESHGFAVSKTDKALLAEELCRGKRFDLAIYDQGSFEGPELADGSKLFATPHVVLGMIGTSRISRPAGQRVHFVVQKPFTSDLFGKTLKAAYNAIASSRRLSSRHEVCIDSTSCCLMHRGERRALKTATIMNISHSGMCVQTGEMLPQEAHIQLSFSIPGMISPASQLLSLIPAARSLAMFLASPITDTTRNQTFSYDALNRVVSAQNAGTNCSTTAVNGKAEYWGNSSGYDAWGNLLNKSVAKCSAENFSYSYGAAGAI